MSGCQKNADITIQTQKDIVTPENLEMNEYEQDFNEKIEHDGLGEGTVLNNNLMPEGNVISIAFLTEFFQSDGYVLLEEPLDVNYRKIFFAVHYIMESPKIFNMAVGFEILDGFFTPYLFIRDFKFLDKDNNVFLDFSKGYTNLYGFNFQYSYSTVEGYTPGLFMETYFDYGNRIADSFTIMWNEKLMTFEDIKPDNPLWLPGL
jgi:hypothetical protein